MTSLRFRHAWVPQCLHVLEGKICHEGMISGHAGVVVLVNQFILLADPELRLALGLSGLQGPAREKEKREKERSELRDLVISVTDNWLVSLLNVLHIYSVHLPKACCLLFL